MKLHHKTSYQFIKVLAEIVTCKKAMFFYESERFRHIWVKAHGESVNFKASGGLGLKLKAYRQSFSKKS
jgi:hypothetical protein